MTQFPQAVAAYYESLEGAHRETLMTMRERILMIAPDSVEVMKYAMPTFISGGIEIAGLLSNKNHIGYYPYSGKVLSKLPRELAPFKTTTGALHVPLGEPLDEALIRLLIETKRALYDEH